MSTKAELMGCEYEAGMCEHYIPGDGKVINGVMRYPGIGNAPTQGGRCLKDDRMISRMDSCPVSGKSAKKLTKVERFGCLQTKTSRFPSQCEYYNKGESVPWCQLAGQYAAINALHECPKTKQQGPTKEELAQKKIEGFQCEGCRFYAHDSASDFYEAACMRVFGRIAGLSECPGRQEKPQETQEKSAVPEGKERWDYRTLPGDVQAVDYWYDVGRKTLFETTCGTLGECRKARDRFFEEQQTKKEISKEESAPLPTAPSTSKWLILGIDVSTKCTGWALREGDRVIEHGSIKATGDDMHKRKEAMRKGIINFLNQPLHYVMIERTFMSHFDSMRDLIGVQEIIKNVAHQMGHTILEPSPTTWRSICPGSAKCDKDAAIEWARLQGYVFESHDEAEAICMTMAFTPHLLEVLQSGKEQKKNGKSKKTDNGGNGAKRHRTDRKTVSAGISAGTTQAA
ncbi:MAG: hypothetical protein AB2L14_25405 [Candidatus Xenobiia bacterium LiM19]